MNSTRNVVVVGAGYAGVTAANRVRAAAPADVTVTVVNPLPDFVERIRLHEFAAGTGDATVPLRTLLHPDIRLVTGTVDLIGEHSVTLTDGAAVDFDHLLYAVGSGPGSAATVRGIEHAHTVAGLNDAGRLRDRLRTARPDAVVTVVGGGLTGIETSAEIADSGRDLRVHLVSAGPVGAGLSDAGRRAVLRKLKRLGVDVHEGVAATGITPDAVTLADGTAISTEVAVWAGPFGVPDLARRSGLPVDDLGRLRTDATLTCLGRPDIVGIGDAVAPPESVARHLRMSCHAAIPLGAHGADTVLAALAGQAPTPLSIGLVLQCVSLGRRAGVVQAVHPDDRPRPLVLRGRTAAFVKERICRSTRGWISKKAPTYRAMSGPKSAPEGVEVSA
ncbi:NAD(P)/FAD-dependent oxidoreductase [Rhodococcus sp. NPDC003318]|uniref:NAD(P)/FAD-dependent oxidoreductase n=1 Tax=Rhodococcus sp. NPDC003318 TaxID=3364503 RepID=UPI00369B7016